MQTTLNQIRQKSPCPEGWTKLLRHLGKTTADDAPLSIVTILDSNGLDDALWCLRAVKDQDREIRLYAVWCARQVQHLMIDSRSIEVLDAAERFANGDGTKKELTAARAAAGAAARAAESAATWDAAGASAGAAAGDAAGNAAWDAAGDAARAAARAAAWYAAMAAAEDAVWGAVWGAARDAAWHAAGNAAGAAAEDAQSKKLREVCALKEST